MLSGRVQITPSEVLNCPAPVDVSTVFNRQNFPDLPWVVVDDWVIVLPRLLDMRSRVAARLPERCAVGADGRDAMDVAAARLPDLPDFAGRC